MKLSDVRSNADFNTYLSFVRNLFQQQPKFKKLDFTNIKTCYMAVAKYIRDEAEVIGSGIVNEMDAMLAQTDINIGSTNPIEKWVTEYKRQGVVGRLLAEKRLSEYLMPVGDSGVINTNNNAIHIYGIDGNIMTFHNIRDRHAFVRYQMRCDMKKILALGRRITGPSGKIKVDMSYFTNYQAKNFRGAYFCETPADKIWFGFQFVYDKDTRGKDAVIRSVTHQIYTAIGRMNCVTLNTAGCTGTSKSTTVSMETVNIKKNNVIDIDVASTYTCPILPIKFEPADEIAEMIQRKIDELNISVASTRENVESLMRQLNEEQSALALLVSRQDKLKNSLAALK